MPNTKSAKKKARRDEKRREHNRYYRKTTLNLAKEILKSTDIEFVKKEINKAFALLDRLGTRRIIHPNKAARWKSKLALHLNKLEKISRE